MKSVSCLVLGLCLLLDPSSIRAQQAGASAMSGSAEIPFHLAHGFLIVVEGRIGALCKLKFILDTGATSSVVDRKLAKKLRLNRYGGEVFNFNKAVAIEKAVFHDVQIGPVKVPSISMLVADLASFSEFTSHVDAIIGLDLLCLNDFAVDYGARKVLFVPREQASADTAPQSGPLCMTIEVQVQDHPLRLIVDTGVKGILIYEDRLLNRITQLRIEDVTDGVSIGRMPARQVTLPDIRVAETNLDPRVLLIKGPGVDVLPGIDGYLGTASLRARKIDFNFSTNTLSWKR